MLGEDLVMENVNFQFKVQFNQAEYLLRKSQTRIITYFQFS